MKVYALPETPKALIFDMDLTLYSCPEYGRVQVDVLIAKLGESRGEPFERMKQEVEEVRKSWAASHKGSPSLSNVFSVFGISMEENIRWRDECYEPAKYLKPDPRLRETLESLSASFALGVVTNNTLRIARKTLACLGVGDCFRALVGLDTCMVPKPHSLPFSTIAKILDVPAGHCVSIGDRYEIDLQIPLEMGMGGVLVDGVEDVYHLPRLFGTI
jgi:phosphoglycolate phosphatase/putative hydrolase of the HAD superfamily